MKELIEKIIEDFNFEEVHEAMQAENWTWARYGDPGVPSISELKSCARELLEEASKMDVDCSTGTGGFRATKIGSKDFGEGLELEFILTSNGFYESWLGEKE